MNTKTTAQKTNPPKAAKTKKGLNKLNLEKVSKKAKQEEVETDTKSKVSKYIYPEGLNAQQRKAFRRNARAERKRMESTIQKLQSSEDKKAKAELKAEEAKLQQWKAETYIVAD